MGIVMILLKNIDLNLIEISKDGKDVTFNFIGFFMGDISSIIKCYYVSNFNYFNLFEIYDEGFPCNIDEVNCFKIEKINMFELLSKKKFNMAVNFLKFVKPQYDLWYLKMESGEIFIDLLCKKIEKDNLVINIS